jgi:hypothetical protein
MRLGTSPDDEKEAAVTTGPEHQPTHSPHLVDLEADECWSLAASRPVGRLAWAGPHGPTVIPVNFTATGSEVIVRTTAYSEVARECDDALVAFEVDDVDPSAHSGWSVLFRGRARLEYGAPKDETEHEVWLSGPRSLRLRIAVTEVTGRRITTAD